MPFLCKLQVKNYQIRKIIHPLTEPFHYVIMEKKVPGKDEIL